MLTSAPTAVCRALAVIAAAALAATAGGCGSEEPDTPSSPATARSSAAPAPSENEEQATARAAAVAAYDNFRKAYVKASASADAASGDLAKYVADPLLSELRNDLLIKKQQGVVTTGKPTWTVTVTKVNVASRPFTVTLEDCFDTTAWKAVFKSSGKDAAVPGQAMKYLVQGEVIQYDDGRWYVREATANRERPC